MGDTEEAPDLTVAEGVRLYLIASVLLTFAAQVLTRHPMRPACSLGALHTYCLETPQDPQCVYCALAQARIWYTLMTGTPAADMAEALTLAQADAERGDLHLAPVTWAPRPYAVLTVLAQARLRAATAGATG